MKPYVNKLGRGNQFKRLLWNVVWTLFARPFPRSVANSWKLFLLRLFGARVHSKSVVYSSAKIYMPWNLEMEAYACLADGVDCYNADKITIRSFATISQKAYLCTASHDITNPDHPLITAPIIVESKAWVAADAFVGMGVMIGEGAVVAARAVVVKDVDPWTVVGGNPAKFIKKRVLIG